MVETKGWKVWLRAVSQTVVGISAALTLAACPRSPTTPETDAGFEDHTTPDHQDGAPEVDGGRDAQPEHGQWNELQVAAPGQETRKLDILWVLDNSSGMLGVSDTLRSNLTQFVDTLRLWPGGMPDVHIGFVTTDLGAGHYDTIGGCARVGGDKGQLGQVGQDNYGYTYIGSGQRYLVDVEPVGCNIAKTDTPSGTVCSSHDCTQANCEQVAAPNETLTLVEDEGGCPRCRNYSGPMEEVLGNYFSVGEQGCGFEQPMEAARKALDPSDPDASSANAGFLRDDSRLVLVFFTNEDDCSASDPDTLFDPDQNDIDSALGFLTSFRCFEFGITCDINDRTVTGPRHDCVPRDENDPGNLLFPISRYTGFLEGLRPPDKLTVSAIAGPVDATVVVAPDYNGRPTVQPSCETPHGKGYPGIRLEAMVSNFHTSAEIQDWAYYSICKNDMGPAFRAVAGHQGWWSACAPAHVSGCTAGLDGTTCAACEPNCELKAVLNQGTETQAIYKIPWCGQVCSSGLCQASDLTNCTYDANGKCSCPAGARAVTIDDREGCAQVLYPTGPAIPVDPSLAAALPQREPTCVGANCAEGTEGTASACWDFVGPVGSCDSGMRLVVVWGAPPPDGIQVTGRCFVMPASETACQNGIDDDQDCLTDGDDPDCAQ